MATTSKTMARIMLLVDFQFDFDYFATSVQLEVDDENLSRQLPFFDGKFLKLSLSLSRNDPASFLLPNAQIQEKISILYGKSNYQSISGRYQVAYPFNSMRSLSISLGYVRCGTFPSPFFIRVVLLPFFSFTSKLHYLLILSKRNN